MDIGKLPAPRVQSRRAWSSRRKCSRAPGSSVSCRTLVSGMVDRRLVDVFFWWSSCIRCWGRLDETAVSRVHFWLARAPSQARGGLRAAAFVCPWRRRRRPNPHIDSLSSPFTRPPLHPSPPSSCLPVAILTPSRDMCARDGLSGTASAETSVRDVCCHPPSGPVRRPGFGMGCRRPSCRRHADDRCGSAGAHGDGDGERELNIVLISPVLGPVPADLPPAITHRPRPLVV